MQVYLQTRRTAIICVWRSATAKWSDSGIELAYRNTTSGQNVQKWKRSFECTLGKRKHPIPQSANLKVSDARQGIPLCISSTNSGGNRNQQGMGNSRNQLSKGTYRFSISGIFHYGICGNLCCVGGKRGSRRQSSQCLMVCGSLYRNLMLQLIQDRFLIKINL